MSGVTSAVNPQNDPEETPPPRRPHCGHQAQQSSVGGVMASLRVIELQLVAFIMVFSATGLVCLLDLAFPAFASAYIIALSRLAFPSRVTISTASHETTMHLSKFFKFYVVAGTVIGLFLPLAYVLGGFARGDDHAVRSATPHLFLLAFQILTENVISAFSLFSPPVRALVPLLYTVRRLFVIIDWMQDVWFNQILYADAPYKDVVWCWFGKMLSVANLLFFATNVFCFLIPQYLPKAFERYFEEKSETHAKMGQDNKHLSSNKKRSQPSDKKSD